MKFTTRTRSYGDQCREDAPKFAPQRASVSTTSTPRLNASAPVSASPRPRASLSHERVARPTAFERPSARFPLSLALSQPHEDNGGSAASVEAFGTFHCPTRTSGWSSKASEAELKGVEGGD